MSDVDFLGALGGAPVPFEVNGVPVLVQPFTVADAQAYRAAREAKPDDKAAHVATLIALSVTRADGTPIGADLAAKLPAVVADALAEKIAAVNGWGDAAGNS